MSVLAGRSLAVAAGTLVAVAACCSPRVPTMEPDRGVRTLTAKDDGGTLDLRLGAQFALRLESIPGAGFTWEIVDGAAGLVELLNQPAFAACPDAEARDTIGGPSCQTFRFAARKAGTGKLRLEYRRPWQPAVPPEKTFTVEIRIR